MLVGGRNSGHCGCCPARDRGSPQEMETHLRAWAGERDELSGREGGRKGGRERGRGGGREAGGEGGRAGGAGLQCVEEYSEYE